MYSIDEKILNAYESNSREIHTKATFNNDVVVTGNKIKSFTVTESIGNTDGLSLGNACSKKLELDMFVPDDLTSIAKAKIQIEIGIDLNGEIEYTPLGVFYVDDYKTTNDYKSVKITAFDAMLKIDENLGNIYTCGLDDANVTPCDIIKDICRQAGISVFIGNSTRQKYVNDDVFITNPQKVEISARDMLGYMAGMLGCNAVIDRSGVLILKKLEITSNNIPYTLQYMGGLEKTNETALSIEYITTGSSVDDNGNGGK